MKNHFEFLPLITLAFSLSCNFGNREGEKPEELVQKNNNGLVFKKNFKRIKVDSFFYYREIDDSYFQVDFCQIHEDSMALLYTFILDHGRYINAGSDQNDFASTFDINIWSQDTFKLNIKDYRNWYSQDLHEKEVCLIKGEESLRWKVVGSHDDFYTFPDSLVLKREVL